MKVVYDMSSLMWTCLLAGLDREAYEVDFEDKKVKINTAAYGYENAVNSIVSTLGQLNVTPINTIFVIEGMNAKAHRLMIDRTYKSKRGQRPPEAYKEFNDLKNRLKDVFSKLGAIFVTQDNVEADDCIAYIAKHTEDDITIVSNDNDLYALNGINAYGANVHTFIGGVLDHNKYGMFPAKYVTLYKAMVGDASDSIIGIMGFGPKAWEKFDRRFGEDGMAELTRLAESGTLDELVLQAEEDPLVKQIYGGRESFLTSYKLAKMYPDLCNTSTNPIQWMPGMVQNGCTDERLRHWQAQTRLVTADNYEAAKLFLQSKIEETPWFSVDLETSVPPEAEDWLAERSKEGKGVDVISSRITGGSISFGSNTQYSYYISVGHRDTNNVGEGAFAGLLELLPASAIKPAHNAAGFELPVLYSHYSELWRDNGWRGFLPNAVDTRISASFWDENQFSHGLKQLTKLLFNYDQETYDEVTGGLRMDQIPATRVVHYGCDDVYASSALWNFFSLFMKLEHTYKPFMEIEQKPMYLQALAFTQGVNVDVPRLSQLGQADAVKEAELGRVIDEFLIARGWDGTVCPVYTELTPAVVKELCTIVLNTELVTQVRTMSKLATLIAGLPEGATLASLVAANDLDSINRLVSLRFTAKPTLNTGSPKQMQRLMYETLGLPVRLRNKPTDTMRKAGIREGTPRTDEDAIKMAIKLGDVTDEATKTFLNSLVEVKSIHTRRGLYWDAYPKMLHWQTGRLHAELRQSATNTRRYAGSNPNLQQMDSDPNGVRSCILPHHKNAVIASLDESAQEVRQLADYCLDPTLLSCYVGTPDQLRDVHSIVACKIAGCTYEEFILRRKSTDEAVAAEANAQRQKAKITLFATLYGAAAPKIAEGLGITEEEAQGYIDAIYAQFPEVKAWREASEKAARDFGCVTIHGGTIRHLAPLINSEDTYTASKALRQAGNARIQSAGGNQIKKVMGMIWDSRLIDDYDYRWLFSVHDETIHSIGREHVKDVLPILHSFMCAQFLNVVPSASSIGIGRNFGQLVETGEVYVPEKIDAALAKLFGEANA